MLSRVCREKDRWGGGRVQRRLNLRKAKDGIDAVAENVRWGIGMVGVLMMANKLCILLAGFLIVGCVFAGDKESEGIHLPCIHWKIGYEVLHQHAGCFVVDAQTVQVRTESTPQARSCCCAGIQPAGVASRPEPDQSAGNAPKIADSMAVISGGN